MKFHVGVVGNPLSKRNLCSSDLFLIVSISALLWKCSIGGKFLRLYLPHIYNIYKLAEDWEKKQSQAKPLVANCAKPCCIESVCLPLTFAEHWLVQSVPRSRAILQYINLFYLVRIRLNSAAATLPLHNRHICVAVATVKVNGLSVQNCFYALKKSNADEYGQIRRKMLKYGRNRLNPKKMDQEKAEKGPDYIKVSATSAPV